MKAPTEPARQTLTQVSGGELAVSNQGLVDVPPYQLASPDAFRCGVQWEGRSGSLWNATLWIYDVELEQRARSIATGDNVRSLFPTKKPIAVSYIQRAPATRDRTLMFQLTNDPNCDELWALLTVGEALRSQSSNQMAVARMAQQVLGGAIDVTRRGDIHVDLLTSIDEVGELMLELYKDYLTEAAKNRVAWVPEGPLLSELIRSGSSADTKLSLEGMQAWPDALRFTSYYKWGDGNERVESREPLTDFIAPEP